MDQVVRERYPLEGKNLAGKLGVSILGLRARAAFLGVKCNKPNGWQKKYRSTQSEVK